MEVLALSIMIGSLGLIWRERAIKAETLKAAKKVAQAEARLRAELIRTNKAFVASCKK